MKRVFFHLELRAKLSLARLFRAAEKRLLLDVRGLLTKGEPR